MTHRQSLSRVLKNTAAAALLFGATACDEIQELPLRLQPARSSPNVVLIVVDTMRADFLGAYGSTRGATPTFDRLAREGVVFEQASTALTATNASIASIFTGTVPWNHGLFTHMLDHLRPDYRTLAETFERAGYQTAGIYSWVSLAPELSGLQRGFQHYQGALVAMDHTPERPVEDPLTRDDTLFIGVPQGNHAVVGDVSLLVDRYGPREDALDGIAEVTTDIALAWVHDKARKPFFLWVHYQDPHDAYLPPSPFDGRRPDDRAGRRADFLLSQKPGEQGDNITPAERARLLDLYAGEIRYADREVGRLLDSLRSRGLLDNTIVVLTADHGEEFGEHGTWLHGLSVYEEATRIPLIFWAPGRAPAGARVSERVRNIDIMPTLLRLIDWPIPRQVEGADLSPLWSGDTRGWPKPALTASHDGRFISVTEGEWKLIVAHPEVDTQLYNLRADPDEKRDLDGTTPAVQERLWGYVKDWLPPWAG